MATAPDVATTILDLNWYIKVKRREQTYFLYVTQDTTAKEIKRILGALLHKKVHDMQLTIPRYGYRKFNNRLSLEQMICQNGETFLLQFRAKGDGDSFEEMSYAHELTKGLPPIPPGK